jgi:hypothetical protein
VVHETPRKATELLSAGRAVCAACTVQSGGCPDGRSWHRSAVPWRSVAPLEGSVSEPQQDAGFQLTGLAPDACAF